MTKQISTGKCGFCNAVFKKAAMTKHLPSCQQRTDALKKSPDKKTKGFHLLVEGRGLPEYWLHLFTSDDATLKDLDSFLRNIWLECCGHLSAFTIEETKYLSHPMEEDDYEDKNMEIALKKVFAPGMKFDHEYDFGTTTALILKVMSELESEGKGRLIRLLARNDPPLIACGSCGKAATEVCSECIWSGKGWLCNDCAQKHKCGEEMLLPVVNSPRVGMCGYTG